MSAEGALYTSMGRSPMIGSMETPRAESPAYSRRYPCVTISEKSAILEKLSTRLCNKLSRVERAYGSSTITITFSKNRSIGPLNVAIS
jgi:hypothetical protein